MSRGWSCGWLGWSGACLLNQLAEGKWGWAVLDTFFVAYWAYQVRATP